ncbi:MoaD/ThiS family protein [Coprothermobacter platensis]|uniref:MoaD/ThiS family protein n=1 Tax=Coprothermobacter platensis TaxID=108819 RepID=UPI00035E3245|nr:MoaD/ThiS family protein [Coprothermobacter platensis]
MIKIMFFGKYSDVYGSEKHVSIEGVTVGQLLEQLHIYDAYMVAINGNVVPLNAKLNDGDEVAVMPTVSGG